MTADSARERKVGTDMERIFGPVTRWHAASGLEAGFPRQALIVVKGRPGTRGVRWITLAAPVTLILFAALVGLHVFGAPPSAPRSTATSVRSTKPAAMPRVTATDHGSGSAVTPVSAVSHRSPDAAPAPSKQAPASRDVRRRPQPLAIVAAPRHSSDRSQAVASGRSCPPGSEEDRCIYRDVTEADGRLRAAYADAVRDGAPSDELAAIHRRWVRARDLSLDAPDEAIRRYDRLAEELDTLSETAGR